MNPRPWLVWGGVLVIAFSLGASPPAHAAVASLRPPPSRHLEVVARPVAPPAAQSHDVSATNTAPCTTPPVARRLESPRDYSDIHLTVVSQAVRPKVSGTAAFAHFAYQVPCGLSEVLAFWSADNPATMPADCVPPGTAPWSAPAYCPATPLFTHVLAWVFVWHEDCVSDGGPAPLVGTTPRPMPSVAPLACTAITFVDAMSGHASGWLNEFGSS